MVEDPLLVVWVGLAGLGVNLIGLFMFIGDSGMHHHHGHSHGHEHGHKHKHEHEHEHKHKSEDPVSVLEEGTSKSGSDCNSPDHEHSDHEHSDNEHSDHEPKEEKKKKKASKNLRAVFLHLLGDALGSVGAILSGLAIHFFTFQERYYFDPAVSILIVALILRSSIPLGK